MDLEILETDVYKEIYNDVLASMNAVDGILTQPISVLLRFTDNLLWDSGGYHHFQNDDYIDDFNQVEAELGRGLLTTGEDLVRRCWLKGWRIIIDDQGLLGLHKMPFTTWQIFSITDRDLRCSPFA